MSDLMQQVIVGGAALGAAAFLLRAVVRTLRPPAVPEACEHCALSTMTTERPADDRLRT